MNFSVLDKGIVRLIDVQGDDFLIEQAARVSYQKGTRQVSDTTQLIRYLLEHDHTSPFEMCSFIFHMKMPFFVRNQWFRHRTAHFSSLNEQSGRYSIIKDECFEPDVLRKQSKSNKQGSDEPLDELTNKFLPLMRANRRETFSVYNAMTDSGVGKELARIDIPLSTYTEFFWKCDLSNIFHLLRLRLDSHAQKEIRVYAQAVALTVKQHCPISYEAFEDYILYAKKFTVEETKYLRGLPNTLNTKQVTRLLEKLDQPKINLWEGVSTLPD